MSTPRAPACLLRGHDIEGGRGGAGEFRPGEPIFGGELAYLLMEDDPLVETGDFWLRDNSDDDSTVQGRSPRRVGVAAGSSRRRRHTIPPPVKKTCLSTPCMSPPAAPVTAASSPRPPAWCPTLRRPPAHHGCAVGIQPGAQPPNTLGVAGGGQTAAAFPRQSAGGEGAAAAERPLVALQRAPPLGGGQPALGSASPCATPVPALAADSGLSAAPTAVNDEQRGEWWEHAEALSPGMKVFLRKLLPPP